MFSCYKHQKFFINGIEVSFMVPKMFEISLSLCLMLSLSPSPPSPSPSLSPPSLWLPIPAFSFATWNFYCAVCIFGYFGLLIYYQFKIRVLSAGY
jgi:hypothetical protein